MKKKAEKIRKKYDFSPMTRMIKNIKIKKKETDTEMDEGTNNASIDEAQQMILMIVKQLSMLPKKGKVKMKLMKKI